MPDVGAIQRSAYAPFQSSRPHRALAEGFSHQFSVPDLRRRVSAASTAAAVPVVSESRTGLGASPGICCARGDGIPPMAIENLFRYPALAVGLMEIENLIRYTARAVGLKPPAMRGEARLRGLYRIISSKSISPRLCKAKPVCAGYGGLFLQRPSALGSTPPTPRVRGA